MWELLLPFFGFLIGTVATLTGIGGGAFIVALLVSVYAFLPANAVGTSLATIVFTAIAATLNYSRQGRIFYKTGLFLSVATAPGAVLGAHLTTLVSSRVLGLTFGFFLILIALRMIVDVNLPRKRDKSQQEKSINPVADSDEKVFGSLKTMTLGSFLSFFGGLASGLLGIGGGVVLVPIMTLTMNLPIHFATATSMFTMVFTSASGVTQHYLANHIDVGFALLLAVGTIIGSQVGAFTSKKISGRNLRRIFGIMLFVVCIHMILKYI